MNNTCLAQDGNYYYCSYGQYEEFNFTLPTSPVSIAPESQVGVCCPAGTSAEWNNGTWDCAAQTVCFEDGISGNCKYTFQYDPAFPGKFNKTGWLQSTENGKGLYYDADVCNFDNPIEDPNYPSILRPYWSGRSTGCCLIQKSGTLDYYFDKDNIKIFGYAE